MTRPPARKGPSPVFLERRSYRLRRMADAARLLPILGALLWLLPLLWWAEGDSAPGAASILLYIFGVWALLVVAAALIAPALRMPDDTDHPETAEPEADR